MTEQKTRGSLDFEALCHASEHRDAETLIAFYADDAEMRCVNKDATPSSPHVLRGKEIAEMLRDVCGRDIKHRIKDEVIGGDRVAFNEDCEHPDGTKVLAAMTLDVRDGKIVRQTSGLGRVTEKSDPSPRVSGIGTTTTVWSK